MNVKHQMEAANITVETLMVAMFVNVTKDFS